MARYLRCQSYHQAVFIYTQWVKSVQWYLTLWLPYYCSKFLTETENPPASSRHSEVFIKSKFISVVAENVWSNDRDGELFSTMYQRVNSMLRTYDCFWTTKLSMADHRNWSILTQGYDISACCRLFFQIPRDHKVDKYHFSRCDCSFVTNICEAWYPRDP